jgi:peptide deformylase
MSFDVPATPVEIVKVGHSALRNGTRSVPQELFGTPALHELIDVMRATLAGSGVGLAAPQMRCRYASSLLKTLKSGWAT